MNLKYYQERHQEVQKTTNLFLHLKYGFKILPEEGSLDN